MKLANIPKTARAITLFAAVVLALAALWPGAANAAGPAQEGASAHTFTGSVTIDGNAAPQGTIVAAEINGVAVATALVDAAGLYSGLQIAGAADGAAVTFKVGALSAAQTATILAGTAATLNLTAVNQPAAPAAPATTPAPPPTPMPTPMPTPASVQAAFRVGPTVRLRPVNDVIDQDQDGIVEVLLRNPVVNDVSMVTDMTVSIPSGFHIYGNGFATDVAAGAASGSFETPPGQSRTIYMNIKSEKVGRATVQFSGLYWPKGNKDLYNPLSFTHGFTVNQPSPQPMSDAPTNPDQAPAPAAPAPAAPAAPAAAACGASPGANSAGDLLLLSLPVLGLAGLAWPRRKKGGGRQPSPEEKQL